jgi:hypothetical protein
MCLHEKLSEESELSICEPSIVIKLALNKYLSIEREISVRKTICHDVVV